MATNYPTSLDTTAELDTTIAATDTLDSPSHSDQHENVNGAVIAVETKLGIGASNAASAQAATPLVHTGSGTSQWQAMSSDGGQDVILYSTTTGDNLTWDASAASLTITGGDGALAFDVPDGYAQFAEAIQANGGVTGNVTGNLTGTVLTAAQTSITSLGTLTGLSVSGNITVTGNVDGRDVSADGTKLDGIESGATADQTAADIRALGFFDTSNDGSGSGLDADKVDGLQASQFLRSDASDSTSGALTVSGYLNGNRLVSTTSSTNQGTGHVGFGINSGGNNFISFDGSSATQASRNFAMTIEGSAKFLVFQNGNATLSGTLTENSDARYKTVTGAAPGMDFFRELDGVSWRWSDSSKDDGTHWGTTAQALQAAIAAVSGDSTMVAATTPDEDILGVRYNDLWGPLVNALKELDSRLTALEV